MLRLLSEFKYAKERVESLATERNASINIIRMKKMHEHTAIEVFIACMVQFAMSFLSSVCVFVVFVCVCHHEEEVKHKLYLGSIQSPISF